MADNNNNDLNGQFEEETDIHFSDGAELDIDETGDLSDEADDSDDDNNTDDSADGLTPEQEKQETLDMS